MHHIQNIYQGCSKWIDLQEVIEPIGFMALGILQVREHFFSISSFSFGIVTLFCYACIKRCNDHVKNDTSSDLKFLQNNPWQHIVFNIVVCCISLYLFNLFAYGFNWFRGKTFRSSIFALRLIACQGAIIAFKQFICYAMQAKKCERIDQPVLSQ